jgi:hypothetical protein
MFGGIDASPRTQQPVSHLQMAAERCPVNGGAALLHGIVSYQIRHLGRAVPMSEHTDQHGTA